MTRVFIWKNGNPAEWEEISFDTYCTLRCEGAWKGHFFTKLHEHISDDTEELILECTEEEYRKNAPAERHGRYLNEWERKNTILPLTVKDLPDCVGLHGAVDGDVSTMSIEEQTERKLDLELLQRALKELSEDDRDFILSLHDEEGESIRSYAKKHGINQTTVHRRKKRIENFLKMTVNTFQKSGG